MRQQESQVPPQCTWDLYPYDTNTLGNMGGICKQDHRELFVVSAGTPSWFKHTFCDQLNTLVADALGLSPAVCSHNLKLMTG